MLQILEMIGKQSVATKANKESKKRLAFCGYFEEKNAGRCGRDSECKQITGRRHR